MMESIATSKRSNVVLGYYNLLGDVKPFDPDVMT